MTGARPVSMDPRGTEKPATGSNGARENQNNAVDHILVILLPLSLARARALSLSLPPSIHPSIHPSLAISPSLNRDLTLVIPPATPSSASVPWRSLRPPPPPLGRDARDGGEWRSGEPEQRR